MGGDSMNLPEVFKSNTSLTVEEHKTRFEELEEFLFSLPQLDGTSFKLREYKIGNMYAREITVPKGACLTGRVYKQNHLEFMISGDIAILSAEGVTKRYTGYNVIEAKAGKRQAGFALEDTIWVTVNIVPDDVTDNLDYTAFVTQAEYDAYADVIDYKKFVIEHQTTEEIMQFVSSTDDMVSLPECFNHLYVAESTVAGNGVYSKKYFEAGEVIGPVRIEDKRTLLGRYCNHSKNANITFKNVDETHLAIASKNIKIGEELTMNYREVINYRLSEEDLCQAG